MRSLLTFIAVMFALSQFSLFVTSDTADNLTLSNRNGFQDIPNEQLVGFWKLTGVNAPSDNAGIIIDSDNTFSIVGGDDFAFNATEGTRYRYNLVNDLFLFEVDWTIQGYKVWLNHPDLLVFKYLAANTTRTYVRFGESLDVPNVNIDDLIGLWDDGNCRLTFSATRLTSDGNCGGMDTSFQIEGTNIVANGSSVTVIYIDPSTLVIGNLGEVSSVSTFLREPTNPSMNQTQNSIVGIWRGVYDNSYALYSFSADGTTIFGFPTIWDGTYTIDGGSITIETQSPLILNGSLTLDVQYLDDSLLVLSLYDGYEQLFLLVAYRVESDPTFQQGSILGSWVGTGSGLIQFDFMSNGTVSYQNRSNPSSPTVATYRLVDNALVLNEPLFGQYIVDRIDNYFMFLREPGSNITLVFSRIPLE